MLSKNQIAPPVNAISINEDRIHLSAFRGKKVLIKFHRFSGCPVAQRQILELIKTQDQLNATGIETIVFIHSPKKKIVPVYKEVQGLHIIADPERRFYRLYHSAFSWFKTLSFTSWVQILKSFLKGYAPRFRRFTTVLNGIPSDFLIDKNGIIQDLHYGSNAGDSWEVSEILSRVSIRVSPRTKSVLA